MRMRNAIGRLQTISASHQIGNTGGSCEPEMFYWVSLHLVRALFPSSIDEALVGDKVGNT